MVVAILGEFIDADPMISSQIYFAKKRGNNASPKTCYFLQYLSLRLHLIG